MKTLYRAVYGVALFVTALVPNEFVSRYHAAQAGHRQAAFPTVFFLVAHWRDDRVAQDRKGHQGRIGVTWVDGVTAKHHHLQVHAYLGGGQASTVGGLHGVYQVGQQVCDLRSAKSLNGLGHAQQSGIAHF
jgi:hypothetical protein